MRKSTYPSETNSIGGRIRARRMDLGLSLKEVADKVKTREGVLNEGYLHSIETNKKMPSIEVAAKICTELGLDFKPIRNAIAIKNLQKVAASNGFIFKTEFLEKLFANPKGFIKELKDDENKYEQRIKERKIETQKQFKKYIISAQISPGSKIDLVSGYKKPSLK